MNIQNEIAKIQNSLKIPVTEIEFIDNYVQIKSGTKLIGGIPYYSVSSIITYDNDKNVVNWLKWIDVYEQNKVEIDSLIVDLIGTNKITEVSQVLTCLKS